MPRRKYRVLLLAAAIVVLLMYRAAHSSEWDPATYTSLGKKFPSFDHGRQHPPASPAAPAAPAAPPPPPKYEPPKHEPNKIPPAPLPGNAKPAPPNERPLPKPATGAGTGGGIGQDEKPSPTQEEEDSEPAVRPPTKVSDGSTDLTTPAPIDAEGIHELFPPAKIPGIDEPTTTIHWTKQPEHFPVAEESYILLPSGKPSPIPKIQFAFPPETQEQKQKRETRQAEVKAEMKRAWGGYKEFAWMHDELTPVSQFYKDPFCGWAATLVDGLDTLWIMGMTEEFDEAAKAVKTIDFTFTKRYDIPVFETIIRYLGGLVAAYDVSGGHGGSYRVLLDKAEELATILMGVFDTPNRLPILYYQWQPESVSQPHRAGTVGVAELGSMSMEFTRLAQLTGKPKYYDAVARITNALEDLQDKGTNLPGLFPENLDASGCNRTATNLVLAEQLAEDETVLTERERYEKEPWPPVAKEDLQPDPDPENPYEEVKKTWQEQAGIPKRPMTVHGVGDPVMPPARDEVEPETDGEERSGLRKRDADQDAENTKRTIELPTNFGSGKVLWDHDCVPQGLISGGWGYESYGMGGSQDSAYEYFPKEYLLLGGLEPKYKKMHKRVVAAVKKWLLYRPMVPDDRDILFSAKVTTSSNPEKDAQYEYEVTHLTCFVGGMFGLGAMIFDSPEDLEIAKKLTDGCVWAYESTPSGIMPEGATMVPCQSVDECKWNQTLWYAQLDPQGEMRDKQVVEWEKKQKELKRLAAEAEEKERAEKLERLKHAGPNHGVPVSGSDGNTTNTESQYLRSSDESPLKPPPAVEDAFKTSHEQTLDEKETTEDPPSLVPSANDPDTYPRPAPGSQKSNEEKKINKRVVVSSGPYQEDTAQNFANARARGDPVSDSDPASDMGNLDLNWTPGEGQVGGQVTTIPWSQTEFGKQHPMPMSEDTKPLSHKEYVEQRIKTERIPEGYVRVGHRQYILRPEAIESVWYMYRITGDPIWQEKGWRMWRAIIKATRTDVGHSAVHDVLFEQPQQLDSMESFWVAETLKYFYLLFSTPDVISLDEWVLNTEAHPFKRPVKEVGDQSRVL